MAIIECEECGRELEAHSTRQRFCCEAHRKRAEGRRRSLRTGIERIAVARLRG